MSRATALLIGCTLALSLVACGSEGSSPPIDTGAGPLPTAAAVESPIATPTASVVPSCGPTTTDESGGLTGVWEANDDGATGVVGSEMELQGITVGASYNVAPGLDLAADLDFIEGSNLSNDPTLDNDGTVFVFSTIFSF